MASGNGASGWKEDGVKSDVFTLIINNIILVVKVTSIKEKMIMLAKFKERCKVRIQCAWKYSGYTIKWWMCASTAFVLGTAAMALFNRQQAVARLANETKRSRTELVERAKETHDVPVDQPIVDLEITEDVEEVPHLHVVEELEENNS